MIAAALDYEDQAEEDKQPAIESAEPAPDECIEKKQIASPSSERRTIIAK
jgi:hypothetical protein